MMGNKLKETFEGIISLLVGLKITLKNFLQPNLTVHYPRKTVKPEELTGYRGHIELVPKEDDPFTPKCIGCGLCRDLCPSGCIDLRSKRIAEEKEVHTPHFALQDTPLDLQRKVAPPNKLKIEIISFELNYNYCSLCGLCVQNCPAGSLRFSKDIYLASFSAKDFEFNLLKRLEKQAYKKLNEEKQWNK